MKFEPTLYPIFGGKFRLSILQKHTLIYINLLPTNEMVRNKNESCLRELGNAVLCINAIDKSNVDIDNNESCGLQSNLLLKYWIK